MASRAGTSTWSAAAAVATLLLLAGQAGHPANAARTPRLSSSFASASTSRRSSRALLSAGFESGPLGPNACVLNTGAYSDVDPTDDNGAAVTCRDQFNCIDLLFDGDCTTATEQGTGIAYHYCKVCLFWSQGRDCPKSTNDAISHVCAADRLLGVVHAPGQPPATGGSSTGKQENWDDGFNGAMSLAVGLGCFD
ncbi:hypothetical protein GPECTOR_22g956 [Gonium pectorale]|uniref:Pherophorin domain-containing protein n=1 Tax=Gonium pectorale TaxID=33097 RepID=A0A150GHP0_GONPE|nr:hypothetical protein GPECTOR_22g956 [Gonium pectorale]|eukprot:KXZ49362.1 hypothetical protein GPECTOR_22g956 [Gonium pectorale]